MATRRTSIVRAMLAPPAYLTGSPVVGQVLAHAGLVDLGGIPLDGDRALAASDFDDAGLGLDAARPSARTPRWWPAA